SSGDVGGPPTSDGGKVKDASASDVGGGALDGSSTEGGSSGDGSSEGGTGRDGPAGMRCDLTTHECVGCASDADCPLGTVCDGLTQRCVSGCSTVRGCPGGFDCCGSTCADLQKDPTHCGTCDQEC